MQDKIAGAIVALTMIYLALPVCPPAQAQRARFAGSRGTAIGYNNQGQYGQRLGLRAAGAGGGRLGLRGGSYTGPNGGTAATAGGTAYMPGVGGIHASGSKGETAAGGAWQRGGATAWQKGVGGAHASQFDGTTANGGAASRNSNWQYQNGVGGSANRDFSVNSASGAAASGYKTNNYDATTGTGTATKGRDYTAKDGSTYGYDSTTSYTKGEGAQKTIETQNKGDYTIDYSKGSKPVVTPTP